MVTKKSTFQILGENIKTIPKADDMQRTPFLDNGVFLFMSFDLADSTAFKTEHPTLWASVFTNFYEKILQELGVENYKDSTESEESNCVRKLWKLIGDEVLLYVRIGQVSDLYEQVVSVNTILSKLLDKIAASVADEVEKQYCKSACIKHCKNVEDIVKASLGIKTAMWIAKCSTSSDENAQNIVYYPRTPMANEGRIDFLGRDIDEGFRIAQYAAKNKIIVSPLLAWLIWKSGEENEDKKKIIKANFKITSLVKMKGVWRNRKVPIIMFHQKFESFEEELDYDEIDLDTYLNIKESGFDDFILNKRFSIDRINFILKDIYRIKEAEEIFEELKEITEIQIQSSVIGKIQQFHIACVILDEGNRVFVHEIPERGLEFGCIKDFIGRGGTSWKEICESGYKEKYGFDIQVEDNPIPIATYYYSKSNAFGIILLAKASAEQEEIDNWRFMSLEELERYEGTMVDNFKESARRAISLKEEGKNG